MPARLVDRKFAVGLFVPWAAVPADSIDLSGLSVALADLRDQPVCPLGLAGTATGFRVWAKRRTAANRSFLLTVG